MIYIFEDCELDTEKASLSRDGALQNIEPQVFALLEILVTNSERVVSKQEIVDYVWSNRNTSNASIDTRIRSARQAIGDNGQDQKFIKTFKNQGFRFVGSVARSDKDKSIPVRLWNNLSRGPRVAIGTALVILLALLLAMPILLNRTDGYGASLSTDSEASARTSSIAVLPFKDISADNDQAHLSEGFTEELMSALMHIDGLKMSSRTSVNVFSDKQLPIDSVSKVLDVAHILEGSLRREGEMLRVSVRLIDTKTHKQLWSSVYDRTLQSENIFEIQNDIARSVASNLTKKLELSNPAQLPQVTKLEAYEHYLIGKKLQKEGTPQSISASVEAFEKVLKIDADYAPAYTALIYSNYRLHRFGLITKTEAREAMTSNLRAAQALAPESWEVLRSAGIIADWDDRPDEALTLFSELVEVAPNYGDAHMSRGIALKMLGRFDEALQAYETAMEIDPLSPVLLSNLHYLKLSLGDLQGAFETAQTNMRWNGDDLEVKSELAYLHWLKGDYADAHHLYLQVLEVSPDNYGVQYDLSKIYRDIGRQDLAIAVAAQPGIKALAHAYAGEFETAKAIASTDPSDPDLAFALHITGQDKHALQYMRESLEIGKFLDPNTTLAVDDYYFLGSMAFLLKQNQDSRAEELLTRLDRYFMDRPFVQYQTADEFHAGIGYHLLRDDPAKALKCLDEAIDRGFSMLQLTREPMFSALEKRPGYAKRLARMNENARRHRVSIGKQIASR